MPGTAYVTQQTALASFNVKTYGATGNGTTDDTPFINAAIAAATASGGTVFFPAGTYAVSGLVIQSKASFTLAGARGAVLTILPNTVSAPNQGAANILTIADCTDFSITGLTINGMRDTKFPLILLAADAASGQPVVAVPHGAGASFVVGQRLNLIGGLTANSGNDKNLIDKDLVIQTITPGAGAANDTITFTTNLANTYHFTANSSLSDGYGPYAANGAYLTFWQTGTATVAGRVVTEEDLQQGIWLLNCQRFQITGCEVYGMWESGIRCGSHIQSAGGAAADACSYGDISDNVIYHCYDQGIGLWVSQYITCTGNVISAAGWAAIAATLGDHNTITGNICNDSVQRIPNDTSAGHGIAIEGGVGNTITGNKIAHPFGMGINLTAGGTLPFGGPAQVATTIAVGSNNTALPTATVNVASTTGFASAGQFTVLSSAGAVNVTYTGKTGTSFTGCTLGYGTLFTGQRVVQYPVFLNNGAALAIGSTTTVVSDGTQFQAGGRYSIIDGAKTERIQVLSINSNTLTLTAATTFYHLDKCQIGQAVSEANTIQGNTITASGDVGIRLASAVRTTIGGNIIDRAALAGIDLLSWLSGGVQSPTGTVIAENQITAPDTSDSGAYYQAIGAQQCNSLTIQGNRMGGAVSTNGAYIALFLQSCTDCVISGNSVEDAYAVGIRLDTTQDWVCKHIQVSNNKVLRCFGEGIILYGADGCVVNGNEIVNCASQNGPSGFGGGLDLRGVTNSQIIANLVIDNGHGGLGLDDATVNGATVHCVGNMIASNVCYDDGQNYDPFNGAHITQGTGIKELASSQGPNTYLNNLVSGNSTNWTISSTGNTLRGNQNFNPKTVTTPGVPASNSPLTNTVNVDVMVYITGGTVTVIAVDGTTSGLTSGAFFVPAGGTISITYTVAPTWVWIGQ